MYSISLLVKYCIICQWMFNEFAVVFLIAGASERARPH